tara:strand:- start:1112 stop:1990 length:879 start_codon:yes stop_codon:yes gene_type:complete
MLLRYMILLRRVWVSLFLGFKMYFWRLFWNFVILICCTCFAKADAISDLYDALQMDRVNEIIRVEGIRDAKDTGEAYLSANSAKRFVDQAKSVYQLESMEQDFKRLLTENLSTADANEILLFYQLPIGKLASELEVSARVAISETEIEEMAKTELKEAKALNNRRLDDIGSVIKTLELVEQNLIGAYAAQFAFMNELSKLGVLELTRQEMIDIITNDEEKLKGEILEWLMAFSHMAYAPMSDEEFSVYNDFSKSDLGIVLNKALFSAYNEMAKDQSQRLANILGEFMKSEDL